MRLQQDQVEQILATTRELLGGDTRVWLFGSRVDDDARGGDIDLLVETRQPIEQPVTWAARLTARLQRRLGDRRIDVLVTAAGVAPEPIHQVARVEGILLTP
ncbi:MAG: nucleotidyltransferase domain-containing protein [Rhodocyclaceae bacterium]|nr:nucleotidyltransferase domain-containing protein [Rhodocyclaceae bacterium]